jgi:hypothetical protein
VIDAALAIAENDATVKIIFRIFLVLVGLAVLVLLFYAEEDWRGKHAWEKYKHELEAKGEVLDWDKFIPPPVPDDLNFFAAPKMQEWFVRPDWHHASLTNELTERLKNEKTGWFGADSKIKTEADAKDYLAWSDQFQSDFNSIREALKRPYARIDGDYSDLAIPDLDFIPIRSVAQTLAQRAHCHLLLNQPEDALNELTLMHDMCRLMQSSSSDKPVTLISTMISVAVIGLYVNIVAEGLQSHTWQESQLTALQKQLEQINLLPFITEAFRDECAGSCHFIEKMPSAKISDLFSGNRFPGDKITFRIFLSRLKSEFSLYGGYTPRGWMYQNMAIVAKSDQDEIDCADLTNNLISPKKVNAVHREIETLDKHPGPYTFFAAIAVGDFTKTWQTTAHNQTLVTEAQIVCALERYHLAHDEYPETLDTLTPQFIEKIPYDIIGGQPLHYRRTNDGNFLLYSIGWNETDDGGQEAPLTKNSGVDYTRGDWVWK